jgi:hypothetical protein
MLRKLRNSVGLKSDNYYRQIHEWDRNSLIKKVGQTDLTRPTFLFAPGKFALRSIHTHPFYCRLVWSILC